MRKTISVWLLCLMSLFQENYYMMELLVTEQKVSGGI